MKIKFASVNSALFALVISFSVVGATVARADALPEIRGTVSLAGLDLSTQEGQSIALDRIHQAARTVCDRAKDPYALAPHVDYLNCVARAEKSALQQVKGPAVVASK